jgi:hypothetical protein
MESREFVMLIPAAIAIGFPLAAIYSVLKRIGWISGKGLMSDSFVIWITWLLSGLGTLLVLVLVDLRSSFSGGSRSFSIASVTALAVSSISVFAAMTILSNSRSLDAIKLVSGDNRGRDIVTLRNILLVSGSAAFALAVGIGIVTLVDAGYTYLFPPKGNPFNIYDV